MNEIPIAVYIFDLCLFYFSPYMIVSVSSTATRYILLSVIATIILFFINHYLVLATVMSLYNSISVYRRIKHHYQYFNENAGPTNEDYGISEDDFFTIRFNMEKKSILSRFFKK